MRIINLIIISFNAIYRRLTRKAFYITGTFVNKEGKRMFFKSTFLTYGNVLPLKSLEDSYSKKFGGDCIILNFNRIPVSMIKYTNKDYGTKEIFID